MGDEPTRPVSQQQRTDDKAEAAYQRGRAAERVEGRLRTLEDHSKAVNGQISRLAEAQEAMNKVLTKLVVTIEQRASDDRERDQRKVSKWTIVGVVCGGLIGFGMLVTTILEVVVR